MEAYYNSIQDAKGVLCGSTRCQLRNYQIHFVEQSFWLFRSRLKRRIHEICHDRWKK
jgi:hypothetical protein